MGRIWGSVPGAREIPAYEKFINAFPLPSNGEAGLPLRYNSPTRIPGKPVAWPLFLTTPLADITFSREKLDKAEEVNDETWELEQAEKGLRLAYRALDISPYCADALNYLALQSRHNEEKLFLYRRAVQVGKAALGEHTRSNRLAGAHCCTAGRTDQQYRNHCNHRASAAGIPGWPGVGVEEGCPGSLYRYRCIVERLLGRVWLPVYDQSRREGVL